MACPLCQSGASPIRQNGLALTVYLNQTKWIDLALGKTGHPRGADFSEVLAVLKQAADEGRACFPLSAAHYYETGKQRTVSGCA